MTKYHEMSDKLHASIAEKMALKAEVAALEEQLAAVASRPDPGVPELFVQLVSATWNLTSEVAPAYAAEIYRDVATVVGPRRRRRADRVAGAVSPPPRRRAAATRAEPAARAAVSSPAAARRAPPCSPSARSTPPSLNSPRARPPSRRARARHRGQREDRRVAAALAARGVGRVRRARRASVREEENSGAKEGGGDERAAANALAGAQATGVAEARSAGVTAAAIVEDPRRPALAPGAGGDPIAGGRRPPIRVSDVSYVLTNPSGCEPTDVRGVEVASTVAIRPARRARRRRSLV